MLFIQSDMFISEYTKSARNLQSVLYNTHVSYEVTDFDTLKVIGKTMVSHEIHKLILY